MLFKWYIIVIYHASVIHFSQLITNLELLKRMNYLYALRSYSVSKSKFISLKSQNQQSLDLVFSVIEFTRLLAIFLRFLPAFSDIFCSATFARQQKRFLGVVKSDLKKSYSKKLHFGPERAYSIYRFATSCVSDLLRSRKRRSV